MLSAPISADGVRRPELTWVGSGAWVACDPDADPNLMTWRIQSAPKAGGTVAQGPPSYSVDRLYVGNGVLYTQSRRSPAVFRLSLDGSQAYPIIANAKAYDYDAGKLVWTEDFGGGIDIWKLDEASLAKTALSAAFTAARCSRCFV